VKERTCLRKTAGWVNLHLQDSFKAL
jgi:hypothetical protein